MGGGPDRYPERYAVADPARLVPLSARVRLVHGADDEVVPSRLSLDYAALAARAGGDVACDVLPGCGHFEVIDPLTGAWPHVLAGCGSSRPRALAGPGPGEARELPGRAPGARGCAGRCCRLARGVRDPRRFQVVYARLARASPPADELFRTGVRPGWPALKPATGHLPP